MNITPEVEKILAEMENSECPVIPEWIDPLVAAGFGGLPVLIIRRMARDVSRVDLLKDYLANLYKKQNVTKFVDSDIKTISTYPECIAKVKQGIARPDIPSAYKWRM